MKLIVTKELPDGTTPGSEIDVHPDVANVLILVDAARKRTAADAKPQSQPKTPEPPPEPDQSLDPAPRSRAQRPHYGTRDLTAKD